MIGNLVLRACRSMRANSGERFGTRLSRYSDTFGEMSSLGIRGSYVCRSSLDGAPNPRLRGDGPWCKIRIALSPGERVRRYLLALALVVVAMPLQAQKGKKRDQYKITAEELAEYGEATLAEVIPKA